MRLSISPAALAHQRRLPKSLLAVPHSRQSHKPCVSAVYKYNLGISSAQLGRRATWQLVSTLRASVQDTATAEGGAAQMEEQVDPLEDFIGWLVANGM